MVATVSEIENYNLHQQRALPSADAKYVPIIKTTDAELRGIQQLSETAQDKMLPIFELTRARVTKKDASGDIGKRLEAIKSIRSGRPFILDLTSHESLMNFQIQNLLNERNGFENWQNFLKDVNYPSLIPAIHFVEEGSNSNFSEQVRNLSSSYEKVAFRVDLYDENTISYLISLYESLQSLENLVLILDAGFLRPDLDRTVSSTFIHRIKEIISLGTPGLIVPCSSAFPQAVGMRPYGEDAQGAFRIAELDIFRTIKGSFTTLPIVHGDYASIHPVRYETRGGAWVPRIDVPTSEHYIYHRIRRDEGGYVVAAEQMLNDRRYESIDSWGDEQIALAALGAPNGLSPSFWISVRENIHISRRTKEL